MTATEREELAWLRAERERLQQRGEQLEVACLTAYAALETIADYDAQQDETGFWDADGDGYEAIEAIKRVVNVTGG